MSQGAQAGSAVWLSAAALVALSVFLVGVKAGQVDAASAQSGSCWTPLSCALHEYGLDYCLPFCFLRQHALVLRLHCSPGCITTLPCTCTEVGISGQPGCMEPYRTVHSGAHGVLHPADYRTHPTL